MRVLLGVRVLLAASEQRPEILLNILPCAGQPPLTENYLSPASVVLRSRNAEAEAARRDGGGRAVLVSGSIWLSVSYLRLRTKASECPAVAPVLLWTRSVEAPGGWSFPEHGPLGERSARLVLS